MHLRYVALAVFAAAAVPISAQTPSPVAPASPGTSDIAAPKRQMIKKIVCRRVDDEENTGSRLGAAPKVCKVIEVPAPAGGAPKPERGLR